MKKIFTFGRNNLFVLRIIIVTIIIPFLVVCFLLHFDWIETEGKTFAKFTFIHKWDWIALIFSFSSLCVSILTYLSQKQTEDNTVKEITPDIQKHLLERLIPRLYINYIISIAIELKCASENFKSYPSEEHMYKMLIPVDLIHQELFYGNPAHFDVIYEIRQMVEIYNREIQLVWDHLMSKITPESKEKDIENILIQKPGTLAWRLSNYIHEVWPDSSFDAVDAINKVIPGHAAESVDIDIPEDYLNKSKFMKFFPDESEREKFIRKVRSDIASAIGNHNTVIIIPIQ